MSSVVVLTSQYVYWGERPLRDALRLYVKGKIEIVAADESRVIHAGISKDGVVFKIPAPLVVRLLDFVGIRIKREEIKFSKEAIYERDDNICQYWHVGDNGRKFKYRCTYDDRTVDHVIPKVRGGTNDFLNVVTCCRHCNEHIKKGRTPREAGLELIRQPFVPRRRKGDMVVIRFRFNPENRAHQALKEVLGDSIG